MVKVYRYAGDICLCVPQGYPAPSNPSRNFLLIAADQIPIRFNLALSLIKKAS
jgi:hypothetical protein